MPGALTENSMFSAWLIGLEDHPSCCGEICLIEVLFICTSQSFEVGDATYRASRTGPSRANGVRQKRSMAFRAIC